MTKLHYGLLSATAAVALFAAPGANAETIGFAPGAAVAGVNDNVIFDPDAADLDAHRIVDIFNWRSVNDTVPSSDASPAFTENDQWFIRVDHGGDGTADAGDSFTESFTFHLISTNPSGLPNTDDNNVYGGVGETFVDQGAGIVVVDEPTHVFMQLSASGTLSGDFNGATASLALDYDFAFFTMVFDADGDVTTGGDQTVIATFGGGGCEQGKCFGVATGADIATLEWEVSWDAALAGVFQDADGNEIANGAPAGSLNEVSNSLFKITRQAVQVVATDTDVEPGTIRIVLDADSEATATTEINRIPEPMTLGLLGAGLLGVGAIARRRRSA